MAKTDEIFSEFISIFDDNINFNVKHPLQYRWSLWYDDSANLKLNPKLPWEENLKKVYTFDTIEDFWG
jgi:translation initiation factor 4E